MPHVVQVSVDGVDATLLRRTSTRGLLSGMVFAVAHAGDRSATVPLRATPFGVFVPARTAGLRTISTGVGIVDGGLGGETRDGHLRASSNWGWGRIRLPSTASRCLRCALEASDRMPDPVARAGGSCAETRSSSYTRNHTSIPQSRRRPASQTSAVRSHNAGRTTRRTSSDRTAARKVSSDAGRKRPCARAAPARASSYARRTVRRSDARPARKCAVL